MTVNKALIVSSEKQSKS